MKIAYALLRQALVMALASFLCAVCPYLLYGALDPKGILRLSNALQWTLIPALGAWSAFRTTRRSVHQLLAWILPPLLYTVVVWLALGYAPSAGVMLVSALTSIVGAAAGAVRNERDRTDKSSTTR